MRSRLPARAAGSALLVLAAACRAAERLPAGAPQPADAPPPPLAEPIHYTLELVDPATLLVAVHVEVAGDADGISDFTLAEGWAGLAECGRDLELVEARGARGALEHERVETFSWRVTHAPGE